MQKELAGPAGGRELQEKDRDRVALGCDLDDRLRVRVRHRERALRPPGREIEVGGEHVARLRVATKAERVHAGHEHRGVPEPAPALEQRIDRAQRRIVSAPVPAVRLVEEVPGEDLTTPVQAKRPGAASVVKPGAER